MQKKKVKTIILLVCCDLLYSQIDLQNGELTLISNKQKLLNLIWNSYHARV